MAASAGPGGGAAAKAAAAGRAYVDFALANANTYRLMFDLRQNEDTADTPLGRAVARARATLSVYGDGLVAAGVPEDEARAMEGLIWSALHGAVTLELAGTTAPGSARETLRLHEAERWRAELIADDEAMNRWMTEHPDTDTQQLRSLVRAARKDGAAATTGQRHGRPWRELFQFLRDAADAAPRETRPAHDRHE